ncbi:MAG: ribonuclease J [Armatimonadetes bacterium]|nr:ribonuclease J [Armatimonadota bacterium]
MATVEVVALGGVGEIGKNCTVVEQGDDWILIDAGLSFPNEEMPGIDIIIPDFAYLVENAEKLKAVFLTHAHEDHVGALPYLVSELNVPIYATEFTHLLIKDKMEEKTGRKDLDLRVMKFGEKVEVGGLTVEPIRITHSIPETAAIAIQTVHGNLLFTADFKFDFTPVDGKLSDLARLCELGKEGVLSLFSDSTNVERPGWGPSEKDVMPGLRKVFSEAQGRVLLTTFASNIHRMQQFLNVAAEFGRKVAVVGRRMESNLDICSRFGYLKAPRGIMITLDDAKDLPAHEVAILTTGSQGEPFSALVQMSKGEYGRMQIKQGDTLIYSARPIPGNEGAIWRTINRLFRQGCTVVYEGPTPVHVSGHAYQQELQMMINLTKPFYLTPVHGEPRHQHKYLELGREMGYPEHRMFTLEVGQKLVFDETKAFFGDRVPCGRVLIDSTGQPGVPDEVLRHRNALAKDGLVTIAVSVDVEVGEIIGEPILQSTGLFISEEKLKHIREIVADSLNSLNRNECKDTGKVRHLLQEVAKKALLRQAGARPVILVTVFEV